ncbi:hypothetical protein SKAU_G00376330 [Synaphobranchus kaupii]|uniref:Biliverdin reductase A n=1 Tax=Synaphobranchus kaupii TaxID=118154 RepID=A0A9Q1ECU9_SYNKA|nr:hypothetical protein SKAU_G00376330 [Synaphobranchus kaupii]
MQHNSSFIHNHNQPANSRVSIHHLGRVINRHRERERMLGTVVVGIGIAGRVRIRDLLAPLPSSPAEKMIVKGFVSRRTLGEQQTVKQITQEDALRREDIQVAIVCTENASHEEHIRKFLEAGKHVCVEYPMVLTHAVAVELWDLAEQKVALWYTLAEASASLVFPTGKVIHEEHIELLTADYKQLKKDLARQDPSGGYPTLHRGPLQAGSGFSSFSGISRLTWLVDLFGELSVKAASLTEEKETRYVKLTAELLTRDQRYPAKPRCILGLRGGKGP